MCFSCRGELPISDRRIGVAQGEVRCAISPFVGIRVARRLVQKCYRVYQKAVATPRQFFGNDSARIHFRTVRPFSLPPPYEETMKSCPAVQVMVGCLDFYLKLSVAKPPPP